MRQNECCCPCIVALQNLTLYTTLSILPESVLKCSSVCPYEIFVNILYLIKGSLKRVLSWLYWQNAREAYTCCKWLDVSIIGFRSWAHWGGHNRTCFNVIRSIQMWSVFQHNPSIAFIPWTFSSHMANIMIYCIIQIPKGTWIISLIDPLWANNDDWHKQKCETNCWLAVAIHYYGNRLTNGETFCEYTGHLWLPQLRSYLCFLNVHCPLTIMVENIEQLAFDSFVKEAIELQQPIEHIGGFKSEWSVCFVHATCEKYHA